MRIVGASSRAERRSPTTSGAPPAVSTSSHVPPASSTRLTAHSAASRSAASLRAPAETDGILSQSTASWKSSVTLDHRQRVPRGDRVALADGQFGDRARLVGGDLVLHLHRLDDAHERALLHRGALLDEDLEDVALHGRGEGAPPCRRAPAGPAFAPGPGRGGGRGPVGRGERLAVDG